jgi:hypothetical protein
LAFTLAEYERLRNERAGQGFQTTLQFAALEPPPPEMQQLMAALRGDQEQTNRFFGTAIGTVSAAEFFAPENVARIMAAESVIRRGAGDPAGAAPAPRPQEAVRARRRLWPAVDGQIWPRNAAPNRQGGG